MKHHLILVFVGLLVSGCSITADVIGYKGNAREKYIGSATGYMDRTGTITMQNTSGANCVGSFQYTGTKIGIGKLSCSDGQTASIQFNALGPASGYGYGVTSGGEPLQFTFGLTEQQSLPYLAAPPLVVTKEPSLKPSDPKPQPPSGSTGSGFFVSKLGHIVTNEHVVRQCGSVTVGDNTNNQVSASVLEKDKRNDLALLRISSTKMASAETKSLISKLNVQKLGLKLVPLASEGLVRSDDVELGEDVLVAGYPYGELFSDTIKVTKGIVSANKGMGDDSGQFQMDAAVQSGNSGGPIYDENGNIVGVVVAQLNKLKVAKAIGSMPENVNFGIKASTVRQFLTSAGLPTKWSNRTERKSTKELAQIAENQTVMVVCNP